MKLFHIHAYEHTFQWHCRNILKKPSFVFFVVGTIEVWALVVGGVKDKYEEPLFEYWGKWYLNWKSVDLVENIVN